MKYEVVAEIRYYVTVGVFCANTPKQALKKAEKTDLYFQLCRNSRTAGVWDVQVKELSNNEAVV